jgi:hypothetical protein
MTRFVGLDVSQRLTWICVADLTQHVAARDFIAAAIKRAGWRMQYQRAFAQIVLTASPASARPR